MRTRKEVLEYGLSFPDTYQDAPFHDSNWILVRIRKNKKSRGIENAKYCELWKYCFWMMI